MYYNTEFKSVFHCYLSLLTHFYVTIQGKQTMVIILNFQTLPSWTVPSAITGKSVPGAYELNGQGLVETRASNNARGRKGLLIYASYRQIYALSRQIYALSRQTYALPRQKIYALFYAFS
jgi:hypothetical protein